MGQRCLQGKVTENSVILAINGAAYEVDVLKDAIRSAKTTEAPDRVDRQDRRPLSSPHSRYHDGLRYPHLERESSAPARLDDILAARK